MLTDLLRGGILSVFALSSLYFGTSVVTIVFAAVLLAGLGALSSPALQMIIPALVEDSKLLYGANSLFDVTTRLSRLIGPSLAAALSGLFSPLYVVVAAAAGFFASVLSILRIRSSIDFVASVKPQDEASDFPRRLERFLRTLREHLDVALVLLSNMAVYGLWNVGLVLGVALLFKQGGSLDDGDHGLKNYAAVLAAFAVGEILSSLVISNWSLNKPWLGYMLLGGAMALIPYPMYYLPSNLQLLAMIVCAFLSGIGAPMFFLPMVLMLQSRFSGGDLLEVTRLRQSLLLSALLLGSTAAPALFQALAPALAITVVGSSILMIGLFGQCAKYMHLASP